MEVKIHTHKTMRRKDAEPLSKVIFPKPFKIDAVRLVFVWLTRLGLIQDPLKKWDLNDIITVDNRYNGAVVFPQQANAKSTVFHPVSSFIATTLLISTHDYSGQRA